MWYINGRVESLVLRRKARDFFHISTERMEQMKKTGFYIIKDKFFEDMPDRILRGIREAIDHIIIVLKIMLREFIG